MKLEDLKFEELYKLRYTLDISECPKCKSVQLCSFFRSKNFLNEKIALETERCYGCFVPPSKAATPLRSLELSPAPPSIAAVSGSETLTLNHILSLGKRGTSGANNTRQAKEKIIPTRGGGKMKLAAAFSAQGEIYSRLQTSDEDSFNVMVNFYIEFFLFFCLTFFRFHFCEFGVVRYDFEKLHFPVVIV